jgi:hypothetical protein
MGNRPTVLAALKRATVGPIRFSTLGECNRVGRTYLGDAGSTPASGAWLAGDNSYGQAATLTGGHLRAPQRHTVRCVEAPSCHGTRYVSARGFSECDVTAPERPSDRPYGDGKEDGMEGAKEYRKPVQVYMWSGAYGKGAMRTHRTNKRLEAEYRNAATLPENRRKNRMGIK